MTALFLSHASVDLDISSRVRDALTAAGYRALFVDFDERLGIAGGRHWEQELYRQLRRADAVIFLATPHSVSSQWCSIEVALARSLGKDVLPVLVAGGTRHPLLEDVQWVDATADERAGLQRLVASLEAAGYRATDSFSWDPRRPPYPGLVPFQADDAGVFFGREQDVKRLVELLGSAANLQHGRVVTVVGPSGSGKSSLVRAGLLPRLARQPDRWTLLPPFVPGDRPTAAMARSLSVAFRAAGRSRDRAAVLRELSDDPSALEDLVRDLRPDDGGAARVLLVLDQAEELLTRCGPDERRGFTDLVRSALTPGSPLSVVATLRAEFLGRFLALENLTELLDDPVVIGAMPRSRLPQVIARPAQRAGLHLAPGLVERIVDDTVGGDALPLMAYALRELAEHAAQDGSITHEEYEALGGVVGALRRQADAVFSALEQQGLTEWVLPTLLRLTTVDPGGEPTRRRLPLSAFRSEQEAVVRAFVDARLLTSDGKDDATAGVEVAHEALLRQWPPLREAIDDARRELELASELERLAQEWHARGRDESYLLRGARLAHAEELGADRLLELGPLVEALVAESRDRSAFDAQRARRANRRLRGLVGGLAVLLVTTVVGLGFGLKGAADAREEATLSQSRGLAATAQALIADRPHVGMLVGLESARTAPTREALTVLARGLEQKRHRVRSLADHGKHVFAVAYSPNGDSVASAGSAGTIRLWSASSGRAGMDLEAGSRPIYSLSFSPDGGTLVSGSADGTVRLWDLQTGLLAAAPPLATEPQAVRVVAFSPDGQVLAAASDRVRLLDPTTGQALGDPLSAMDGWALAFSPLADRLLVTRTDGTFQLWDWRARRPLTDVRKAHDGAITEAAFSPDGRLLASAGHDGTLKVWDGATLRPAAEPFAGTGVELYAVAWNPAGNLLATAGLDGDVQLWDWTTRRSSSVLTGAEGETNAVAFPPGGRSLLSAGEDGLLRLWDVSPQPALGAPLIGPRAIYDITLSSDGRTLASTDSDFRVRTWDAGSGRLLEELPAPADFRAFGVAMSPDGRLLAAASEGTIILWDARTGRVLGEPLVGPDFGGDRVDFSPDGRVLAAFGGEGGMVQLWDVRTRRLSENLRLPDGRPLRGLAFRPDSKVLVTTEEQSRISFWDVASGRPLSGSRPLPEEFDAEDSGDWGSFGLAFAPDGATVASVSSEGRVHFWDAETYRHLGEPLEPQEGSVLDVAFSADGQTIATGTDDGSLQLWDVATRQPLVTPLQGTVGAVTDVRFDPLRERFLSTGEDGALRSWPSPARWVTATCTLIGRNLDRGEWDRWIGKEQEYVRTCPRLPSGRQAPTDAAAARYTGPLSAG